MQLSPKPTFESALAEAERAAELAGQRASRLGIVRLLAFFGIVALVVLVSVEVHIAAGIALIFLGLLLFNKLIGLQQAADAHRDKQQRIVTINEGELASLNYDFEGFDGGADLRDPSDQYTADLDVFGENSIFQLLNRTASLLGRGALASYARKPLQQVEDIESRQAAVRELSVDLSWAQGFLASGADVPDKPEALDALRAWAASPPRLQAGWWPAAMIALSIFNVVWLASFVYWPFYLCLLGYLPTAYLLYRAKPEVDEIHKQTEASVALLARYRAMLADIEARPWTSPLLQSLASHLTGAAMPASEALETLADDAKQLAIRVNPYILLLNLFSFWEIRYARRLERWKQTHLQARAHDALPAAAEFELPTAQEGPAVGSTQLDAWLKALGAFDALTSFGGVAYRYPSWTFASFDGGPAENARISGQQLHHPLLPPGRSVANDFSAPARGHIHLLTGSNMAGKSTFLRTVGLHLAMAHWGCPTPAAKLALPILLVYTSMRTQDNLHLGASAFYAELQRIRFVVKATERGEPVFFLLDEILKGTNSQDRHEGGRALLEQLLRFNGAGIVATHDLELGAMSDETDRIDNLRLEVDTDEQGQLYFDYTVKDGLAQSRNATILMEQMGLGV